MRVISFLTSAFNQGSGGVIYDQRLFQRIEERYRNTNVECKVIDDESFSTDFPDVSPDFIRFNKIYKQNKQKLFCSDVTIINSRLYTRFLLVSWRRWVKEKRIVIVHHHFNFLTEKGIRRRIHKFFELRFLKKADLIITPNQYVMDISKKFGLEKKMMLIEAEALILEAVETETKENKSFLFVGTIESRKGVKYALEAFNTFHKKHEEFRFDVVGATKGNEHYYEELQRYVNENGLEEAVLFHGRVSDEQKEHFYQAAYAFLFPSLNEGYGVVIAEAMQHGLPVLAFNNSAMPYTVNETNGILVENKDLNQLCEAMDRVVENKELYQELKQGAYRTATSLVDFDRILLQYEKLFCWLDER